MVFIHERDLKKLSFPDTKILKFDLDFSNTIFILICQDAYIEETPKGRPIFDVRLSIKNFSNISIKEYTEEKKWKEYKPHDAPPTLKDICEFVFSPGKISLKGFSKENGLWTEFLFEGGIIKLSHSDEV